VGEAATAFGWGVGLLMGAIAFWAIVIGALFSKERPSDDAIGGWWITLIIAILLSGFSAYSFALAFGM